MADITEHGVPRRRWWRRRERPAEEAVDIADDADHAWWAARDGIGEVPQGRRRHRGDPPRSDLPPGDGPGIDPSYWSPESLYESSAGADDPLGEPDADRWTRGRGEPVRADDAIDPWDVLGLDTSAPWADVVRRHRDLAKRFHPDHHGTAGSDARAEAEQRMAEVNAAFDELRRIYRAMS
jgi:hypothetical protein